MMNTKNPLAAIIGVALLLSVAFPLRAVAGSEQAELGFSPDYPVGPAYDVFVATLPGLGFQSDDPALGGDGDGKLNDERCQTNSEARLAIVGATLNILVAAGTACGAIPSIPATPGPREACFVVLGIAATALQAEAIAIAQCGFQDGLVNSAEIEAGLENTKHAIASGLERNLAACDQLVSLRLPQEFGGRAEEVRGLVETRLQEFETVGEFPDAARRAQDKVMRSKANFEQSKYSPAYNDLCAAYKLLVFAR